MHIVLVIFTSTNSWFSNSETHCLLTFATKNETAIFIFF